MASVTACGGDEPAPTPPSPNPSPSLPEAPTLLARVEGDNLYVSFVGDDGYEMCYWFCPTMENKLYSFHRVGYRAATSASPSVDDIASDNGMTWLNLTTSDNIGPIALKGEPWVGGNHLVNGLRSADTQSVHILADNNALTASDGLVSCHHVTIDVVNHLYDPLSEVVDGKFSKVLLTETVHYVVTRNAIDVTVNHTFVNDASGIIETYYGMQSMFYKEDLIMTPHGPYNDFTPLADVERFTHVSYPHFNRFIEMRTENGWCQASHLLPEGIGDHRYVGGSNAFITTTYGKQYHVLVKYQSISGGMSYSWRGVYSWFRPIVNDDDVLVYSAVLDGVEAIYVDAKRPCSVTFALPARWAADGKKVVVAQADNGMTLNADNASQVRLSASGAGTAILKLAAR